MKKDDDFRDFLDKQFNGILGGFLAICLAGIALLEPTSTLTWIALLVVTILYALSVYFVYLYITKKEKPKSTKDSRRFRLLLISLIIVVVCFLFKYCSSTKASIDTEEIVPESTQSIDEDIISSAEVGTTFSFGAYWQREFPSEKEPILWRVLAKENDNILVLSEYCLDCKPFFDQKTFDYYQKLENSNSQGAQQYLYTWENSSLRGWLNGTFLNEAFNANEQGRILEELVPADANPDSPSSISAGNPTEDKVFLLSLQEAQKYFGPTIQRQAFPTKFARSQGADGDKDLKVDPNSIPDVLVNIPCWWWLRTPGTEATRMTDVKSGGTINTDGRFVYNDNFSVRPAMWLRTAK